MLLSSDLSRLSLLALLTAFTRGWAMTLVMLAMTPVLAGMGEARFSVLLVAATACYSGAAAR